MFQTPLHHCYLVSARDVSACTETVQEKLRATVGADPALSIESITMDILTIEIARELRERGQQKASGEIRCLIYGFNTITVEAQNALLKIIENPAAGTHFFFVTPDVSNLLETVRSRSWIITDICAEADPEQIRALAESFLAARGLAERLQIVEKLETKEELRWLVRALAKNEAVRKNTQLGQAVELVADYSLDTGASVKLL
ncbi:MAG: hypothetical protein WD552_02425, partial [Candidatus Paceibacterota bacterium]